MTAEAFGAPYPRSWLVDAACALLEAHAAEHGYPLVQSCTGGSTTAEWREYLTAIDAADVIPSGAGDRRAALDAFRKTGSYDDDPRTADALRGRFGMRTAAERVIGDAERVADAVETAPNVAWAWRAALRVIGQVVGVPVLAPVPACPDSGLADLARAAVEDAQAAEREAATARGIRRDALRQLVERGLSYADVGAMVGLSRQRVGELVKV